MTTEMFGTPFGSMAAENQINKNVLSGLSAQKTLGEIEMQPTELAAKQAQARLWTAQAKGKEEEAEAQKVTNQWNASWGEEEARLRLELVGKAAEAGQVADMSDVAALSADGQLRHCLLYTSPSPRDRQRSRMPSSA